MIVISQILSLWGNSVTNATVEGKEHTQVSCTYTGQLLTVLQNSVAKKNVLPANPAAYSFLVYSLEMLP